MTGYQSKRAAAHDKLAQPAQEPVCPACKAEVLYECVACSSNNYPPHPAQEPVAWMYQGSDEFGWRDEIQFVQPPNHPVFRSVVALYTAPPQRTWVGLTDEDDIDWEEGGNLKDLVKAIEAKLREKNT